MWLKKIVLDHILIHISVHATYKLHYQFGSVYLPNQIHWFQICVFVFASASNFNIQIFHPFCEWDILGI